MSDSPIRVFSLTYAEDAQGNAQQGNAREIFARLPPDRFEATLLSDGTGPASIAARPHVRLLPVGEHGRARKILGRLLRGGFDLLFYPGPGLPESIYLRLRTLGVGRRTRVLMPVEGDVSQLDEVPAWIRRRVDRLHRSADALFPITDHVSRGLEARCGRTGEVVPVGVDLGVFQPRAGPRAPGPLRVLCVGTVKAWKRPELAREAALAMPQARFTWIGGGERLEEERAKAPPNLELVGPVPPSFLPSRYAAADVLLHPSRMEGLPKVLLEAMASGLPVVAFDAYRPDFVAQGGAGFVVSTPAEMVQALRRIEGDEGERVSRGLAAREAAAPYSWDRVAARWVSIFEREAALARAR